MLIIHSFLVTYAHMRSRLHLIEVVDDLIKAIGVGGLSQSPQQSKRPGLDGLKGYACLHEKADVRFAKRPGGHGVYERLIKLTTLGPCGSVACGHQCQNLIFVVARCVQSESEVSAHHINL